MSSPPHLHVFPPPHSGWISALVVLKVNTAVAVLMLLVALFFTGIAVLGIVMLKRVRGCRWGLESDITRPWGLGWNIQEQLGRARQMEGFSANGPGVCVGGGGGGGAGL